MLKRHLAELEAEGWIKRVVDGHRGRRAEYAVFASRPCCPMHAPQHPTLLEGPVETGDNGPAPVDNRMEKGAGPVAPFSGKGPVQGDPNREKGATKGATPEVAPFVTSISTHLGENVSPGRAHEETPLPVETHIEGKCAAHQHLAEPPPCRACARARHQAESATDQERRRLARIDAEARQRRRDEQAAQIAACDLCGPDGKRTTGWCTHDPAEETRRDAQVALRRQAAREGRAKIAAVRAQLQEESE